MTTVEVRFIPRYLNQSFGKATGPPVVDRQSDHNDSHHYLSVAALGCMPLMYNQSLGRRATFAKRIVSRSTAVCVPA